MQNNKAKAGLKLLKQAILLAFRALTPVWKTSPTALRYWAAGLFPEKVWGREFGKAAVRLQTIPYNHPVMVRLQKGYDPTARLCRLLLSMPPVPKIGGLAIKRLDPVAPNAPAVAGLFGLGACPGRPTRLKGNPGPRLAEADPEAWWEANRPKSF